MNELAKKMVSTRPRIPVALRMSSAEANASFAVTSASPSIPSLCVSVVKIESRDAFRDATGELLISKSAVPEITDLLWDDDQVFVARDLSESPSSTSSVTRRSSRCVVRAPRRPCSSPGASTPTAESTCSTWPWATRSPRFAGPSSFAAWSPAACVCGPRSPPTAPQGSSARSGRPSPPRSASAVGSIASPTSDPSSPTTRPPRSSPTSTPCPTRRPSIALLPAADRARAQPGAA